jgi:UDP-2-acetamido-2,6-beta-L-arabino-hexul-4-ose reductase
MKTVLVTGAAGFIGMNLVAALRRREDVRVETFTKEDAPSSLDGLLNDVNVIYHLAGVNRPETEGEFESGNVGVTREILDTLARRDCKPLVVLSSSIQAERDNPYGRSKAAAEDELLRFHEQTGAPIAIYRLPGVFGKWSRSNYNTVVATFCHNIARGLDVAIHDPNTELEVVYVDDVVNAFLRHLEGRLDPTQTRYTVSPSYRVTLGGLVERIRRLREMRETLVIPDFSDALMRDLYATYLSFLPEDEFAYPVTMRRDNRGWLFELIKSEHFGQIFVSKTLPGITRGHHYHDTKIEKFCVIQGEGVIRFRQIHSGEILGYPVGDEEIKVVDIPPGYTHSIENVGKGEMIVLFWADEIFDPERPDTHFCKV